MLLFRKMEIITHPPGEGAVSIKEDIQANEHIERYLPPLVIKESQIKTVMRYHRTPTRMASVNISDNTVLVSM